MFASATLGALALTLIGLMGQRSSFDEMNQAATELVPEDFVVADIHHRTSSPLIGQDEAVLLTGSKATPWEPGAPILPQQARQLGWKVDEEEELANGEAAVVSNGSLVAHLTLIGGGPATDLAISVYRQPVNRRFAGWPLAGAALGLSLAGVWRIARR